MRFLQNAVKFFKKADMILLVLCVITSIFGIVMVDSATAHIGGNRYILIQTFALLFGIALYVFLSFFDAEILTGRPELLFVFNMLFLASLLIWGVEGQTGNRSWLAFSWLPFSIQPAEICKITFILISAKMMRRHERHISSPRSVLPLAAHLLITIGLIVVVSHDMGVALIYVFIFLLMCFAGGVSKYWFLAGVGGVAAAAPILWNFVFRTDQKNRILALFDPSIDKSGQGVLWQTNLSLRAIQGGGVTGQGLYRGEVTQSGINPQQHNDFIFSAIAEELGVLGGIIAMVLLCAIICRCIYVGIKSRSYMDRLICVGIAAMLLFQVLINIGMCLGLLPVVGLALPFLSYGGSSIVSTFFAMGLISGIYMRPAADREVTYVRPPEL